LPFLLKNLDGLSWEAGLLRPSRVAALDAPRSAGRKKSTQNLVGSFQKSGPDEVGPILGPHLRPWGH
jgi:hypothetical protein